MARWVCTTSVVTRWGITWLTCHRLTRSTCLPTLRFSPAAPQCSAWTNGTSVESTVGRLRCCVRNWHRSAVSAAAARWAIGTGGSIPATLISRKGATYRGSSSDAPAVGRNRCFMSAGSVDEPSGGFVTTGSAASSIATYSSAASFPKSATANLALQRPVSLDARRRKGCRSDGTRRYERLR